MKKLIFAALLFFLAKILYSQTSQFSNSKLTYKIITAPRKTFGYDIYSNNKLSIHQPTIPALSGNKGFKTKIAAKKMAKFIIIKIKNGEMPPKVSIEEMKKMKVIK